MIRTIFMGSGDIGLPALRLLCQDPRLEMVGVFTQPDRPVGRGLQVRHSLIKSFALAREIPVFQPASLKKADGFAQVSNLRPELIIVMAYGQLLPVPVLDLPRLGCINLHASILPKYRGAAPIHAAILSGDTETGVTVMLMDAGMDTGDMLLIHTLSIGPEETSGALHDRLADCASAALAQALPGILDGSAARTPQDSSQASYAPKLSKSDGLLRWQDSAAAMALRVRAMNPWPGAHASFADPKTNDLRWLKIHRAKAVSGRGDPGAFVGLDTLGPSFGTGDGLLVLQEVQAEGRKRMSGTEWARGVHLQPGIFFCGD